MTEPWKTMKSLRLYNSTGSDWRWDMPAVSSSKLSLTIMVTISVTWKNGWRPREASPFFRPNYKWTLMKRMGGNDIEELRKGCGTSLLFGSGSFLLLTVPQGLRNEKERRIVCASRDSNRRVSCISGCIGVLSTTLYWSSSYSSYGRNSTRRHVARHVTEQTRCIGRKQVRFQVSCRNQLHFRECTTWKCQFQWDCSSKTLSVMKVWAWHWSFNWRRILSIG